MKPLPAAVRHPMFDWDNTLVDNWRCVQAALNTAVPRSTCRRSILAETLANARLSPGTSFPRMFGAEWSGRGRFSMRRSTRAPGRFGSHCRVRRNCWTGCGINDLPAAVVSNSAARSFGEGDTSRGTNASASWSGPGMRRATKTRCGPSGDGADGLGVEAAPGLVRG